jgi:hypothetical protein
MPRIGAGDWWRGQGGSKDRDCEKNNPSGSFFAPRNQDHLLFPSASHLAAECQSLIGQLIGHLAAGWMHPHISLVNQFAQSFLNQTVLIRNPSGKRPLRNMGGFAAFGGLAYADQHSRLKSVLDDHSQARCKPYKPSEREKNWRKTWTGRCINGSRSIPV